MLCSLARLWAFSVDRWFVMAMRGLRGVAHSQATKKTGANSEGWREGPESRNYAPFLKLGLLMLTSWTTTFSTIPPRNIMFQLPRIFQRHFVSRHSPSIRSICQNSWSIKAFGLRYAIVDPCFNDSYCKCHDWRGLNMFFFQKSGNWKQLVVDNFCEFK